MLAYWLWANQAQPPIRNHIQTHRKYPAKNNPEQNFSSEELGIYCLQHRLFASNSLIISFLPILKPTPLIIAFESISSWMNNKTVSLINIKQIARGTTSKCGNMLPPLFFKSVLLIHFNADAISK